MTVTGLVGPALAVASPGAVAGVPAAAAADLPQATEEEKVRALGALGIFPDNDLLLMSDRDFVFQLWRRSPDSKPEVKSRALSAHDQGSEACTLFIRVGVFDANEHDKVREVERETAARLAREAKSAAAAVLGIVATPEMLVLSDWDFIATIWRHAAAGPRVKSAAFTALQGTTEDRTAFIANRLREEHRQDVIDAIERDKETTEAEKEALRRRDALARAATVIRVVATPEILALSDLDFVREIWNRATRGTEVAAAAESTMRSARPADWKTFIYTGIYEANDRDIEAALRLKAEQDRRLTTQIKAKAENSMVHPALVAAAAAALAGSDQDVDRFLRIGQYEALTQSIRTTTPGRSGWYVQAGPGDAIVTAGEPGQATPAPVGKATWRIVDGLADPECHSLESVDNLGYYLRHDGLRVKLAASDGSAKFKNDATWCARNALKGQGVSLESKSAPGRYLRHLDAQVWAANTSFEHPFDRSCAFNENATWQVDGPNPTVTQPPAPASDQCVYDSIAEKAKSLGGKATLGEATSPESGTPDGIGKFRHFENGSIYWSPATHAHFVMGAIRARWSELGWEKKIGYPITDEEWTEDKRARVSHFQKGSIYWTRADGAKSVHGSIHGKYKALGLEKGLGLPTTDETETPDKIGRFNHFERGSIYWTNDTGAHAVLGGIRSKWAALGWERGLGYPTTDEDWTEDRRARVSRFQRGSIYWTNDTGAKAFYGSIHAKYKALGLEKSLLGLPVNDETGTPDEIGRFNHFENGSIYWTPNTGAQLVYGCVKARWAAADWEKGRYGYPIKDTTVTVDGAGRRQYTGTFQRGTITCGDPST